MTLSTSPRSESSLVGRLAGLAFARAVAPDSCVRFIERVAMHAARLRRLAVMAMGHRIPVVLVGGPVGQISQTVIQLVAVEMTGRHPIVAGTGECQKHQLVDSSRLLHRTNMETDRQVAVANRMSDEGMGDRQTIVLFPGSHASEIADLVTGEAGDRAPFLHGLAAYSQVVA